MSALTPYPEPDGGSTSGHSGGETSRESVQAQDKSGRSKRQQQRTLGLVGETNVIIGRRTGGYYGLTVHELCSATDMHHGQASRALSVLHKSGLLQRLKERRGRASIYVLPEYVAGRETVAPGRNKKAVTLAPHEVEALERLHDKSRLAEDIGTTMVTVRTTDLQMLVKALAR